MDPRCGPPIGPHNSGCIGESGAGEAEGGGGELVSRDVASASVMLLFFTEDDKVIWLATRAASDDLTYCASLATAAIAEQSRAEQSRCRRCVCSR